MEYLSRRRCQRNLAVYLPGVEMPGVDHIFVHTGSMPLTGPVQCALCGERPLEPVYPVRGARIACSVCGTMVPDDVMLADPNIPFYFVCPSCAHRS
jgi:hypothetical protein